MPNKKNTHNDHVPKRYEQIIQESYVPKRTEKPSSERPAPPQNNNNNNNNK